MTTEECKSQCCGWMKLSGGCNSVNETDLWCYWLWCVCGGRAPWTLHSLRPAGYSLVRPSCSHVQLHLLHTGYPEAGSPVLLMRHRQIYRSAGGGGHRITTSGILLAGDGETQLHALPLLVLGKNHKGNL